MIRLFLITVHYCKLLFRVLTKHWLRFYRIEIQPKSVYWSESGNLVCLATEDTYYVLKYNAAVVTRARQSNTDITEDGIADAFEVSNKFTFSSLCRSFEVVFQKINFV